MSNRPPPTDLEFVTRRSRPKKKTKAETLKRLGTPGNTSERTVAEKDMIWTKNPCEMEPRSQNGLRHCSTSPSASRRLLCLVGGMVVSLDEHERSAVKDHPEKASRFYPENRVSVGVESTPRFEGSI